MWVWVTLPPLLLAVLAWRPNRSWESPGGGVIGRVEGDMVPTGAWWWWWWWWWCSTRVPLGPAPMLTLTLPLLPLTLSVLLVPLPLFHGWWPRGGEPGDGRPSLEDWEKQVPKSKSRFSWFTVWPGVDSVGRGRPAAGKRCKDKLSTALT